MILLWLLLPTIVAFLALCRYSPDGNKPFAFDELIFRLSLAGPLGLGFGSVVFFVWSLCFSPVGRLMVLAQTVILVLAAAGLFYDMNRRRKALTPKPADDGRASNGRRWWRDWFVVGCGGCLALGLFQFLNVLLRTPHGHWDAWAIWNLRARFLYRAIEHWENAFSPLLYWSSPGHPPGLPAAVANGWKFVADETVAIPMIVAAVFFLSTIGILGSALSSLTGRWQAGLAVVCLTGTPLFLSHGASQYADVPLGFFLLATVICLVRYDSRSEPQVGWLVLAGLTASLAAWTKNEGWAFLLAVLSSRLLLAVKEHCPRRFFRETARFLTGAAPVAAVGLVFKIFLAPPSSFVSAQNLDQILTKLSDLSRYGEVLVAFGRQMSFFGEGIVVAMAIYGLLAGARQQVLDDERVGGPAIILAISLIAFFMVYVITPENLEWHLRTSIHRLLLQLWPVTILLYGLVTRSLHSGDRPELET